MFYILNFRTHTFSHTDLIAEVQTVLSQEAANGADLNDFEIINASDPDVRICGSDFEQFCAMYSS